MEPTTRRFLLKTFAALPLAFTFGLLSSPLLRYLRPTIKPLGYTNPSDQPAPLTEVSFTEADFPEAWTCVPFTFSQTYKEYNPEGREVRKIPGYAVKLPTGDVVAYSRICPHLGCIFNFVKDPAECAKGYNFKPNGPVFACPCHLSVYDIAQNGKVVSGPAPRPPRKFEVKSEGGKIVITSLEGPAELPDSVATTFGASLGKANDWLKTRITNIDIFDEHYQRDGRTNPFYSLGSIFYLVWVVVIVTGVLLMIWYIPTKPAAFDSILRIQNEIPFGNIIRGMHKYGADAMIIAATMRLYRIFLSADYKPSREFNAAIGLITLLLAMYSGLTGYLLIWNQRAFWATKVFATFPTYMDQFPVMGDFYQPLVKSVHMGWNTAEFLLGGGGAITQETITRFFSLHIAFTLIPLIIVELYFYHTGFTRIALNWTKRVVVIFMLLAVSIIMPAAIGARSNPDVTPLPILSDWYFLGLYQMYKYLEPVVATEITMVIPLTVMILPFLDVAISGPDKNIMKRPIILMTSIMAFINWIAFSLLIIANIANIHNDPPYWRDFLFLMVDFGVLWQLALVWASSDLQYRLRSAGGAMVMGFVCAIQSVWALWYFFMAKTEMFLSPILQAFVYFLFRPFMGSTAETAENLTRAATKSNIPYWEWAQTLQKHTPVPYTDVLVKVQSLAANHTPIDFIFQMIPSFIPGVQYQGLVDYMVSNQWCSDYAKFCDRMNGVTTPYPMPVPPLDWLWMLGGLVAMLLCFATAYRFRRPSAAQSASKAPPAPTVAKG